jgi:hypothetical protein
MANPQPIDPRVVKPGGSANVVRRKMGQSKVRSQNAEVRSQNAEVIPGFTSTF